MEESENGMAIYETDGSGRSRIGRIRHGCGHYRGPV